MTEKEKQIYKSGNENKTGYHFKRFSSKSRIIIAVSILAFLFFSFIAIFDNNDIFTWSDIKYQTKAIEGVKPIDSNFAIYFLDVGQSDCTIIVCDGEVMLVDCGTHNQVNTIKQSLLSLNIKEIDYMLITHQHNDHMGGAAEIIKNWRVNSFIMPKLLKENNVYSFTYDNLLNILFNENDINIFAAQDCKPFMLGSARVEFISPINQDKNLNNMSVVIKITYGNTSYLLQGDAESKIENYLLNSQADVDVDVLKIGHHGSNTSTNEKYLNAVSPKVTIVSSGYDNTYNHPNDNVLNRVDRVKTDTFVTALHGNITITSNGSEISVYPQKNSESKTYN